MRSALYAATGLFALLAACDSEQPVNSAVADPEEIAAIATEDTNEAPDSIADLPAPESREAALALMDERHENMESIGDAMKVVNRELKAGSPDLAAIRASADEVARLAPQVPSWFPQGTGPDVGETEAKAEIWQDPDDFSAKAADFEQAALAFQAAAQGSDVEAIRSSFGNLGKTCKACHDRYREEH